MSDKEKRVQVVTPEFRVSFPAVFEPKSFEGSPLKYSVQMLFDKKADLKSLKAMAKAAANIKWPNGLPKKFRNPFRDGDETDRAECQGMFIVNATSKQKPGLVDCDVQPIISEGEFYGGCYARATLTAFAYDKAGNVGVSFGLQNLQKLRDGEPFSGKTKAEDDFDAVDSPTSADTNDSDAFADEF